MVFQIWTDLKKLIFLLRVDVIVNLTMAIEVSLKKDPVKLKLTNLKDFLHNIKDNSMLKSVLCFGKQVI